ncbi:MAG: deoxynucleoside kinase [Mycoplasmataceae bacterium]|nr:deoxynucleoside kinase [Mycoplasmataceae bacterium]
MRIVISGTVGVGKSTTTDLLVKTLRDKGYEVNHIKENTVVSPYLTYFYTEPSKWAFIAQLDFLIERFKQWLIDEKKRSKSTNKKLITIYDRHFIDDYIFAELHSIKENISQINSIVYQTVYKELLDKLIDADAKPDFFFLLEADLSTIVERLKKRGRKIEVNTEEEYWKELYDSYYIKPKFKYHFNKYSKKVLPINTENKDSTKIVSEIITKMNIK